jgi:hypothetical protein
MRQLLILALMGECVIGVCGQSSTLETVELCTVASNIKAYNGQQARVKAFLGAGAEGAVLYDPKCQDGKPLVYVSFKPKATGQMKALRRIVAKKHYAFVTIEGTMRGPEPVKIDPNLPDWLKDRFKDSYQRYGHLNSFEMMIEVVRVVSAQSQDDGY